MGKALRQDTHAFIADWIMVKFDHPKEATDFCSEGSIQLLTTQRRDLAAEKLQDAALFVFDQVDWD